MYLLLDSLHDCTFMNHKKMIVRSSAKSLKLQVKSDLMLVINSYTIDQFDSYFDNHTIDLY